MTLLDPEDKLPLRIGQEAGWICR